MYEIEKGIPLPTNTRNSKYPYKDMQVGDSFLIPSHPDDAADLLKRMRNSMFAAGKRHGIKLTAAIDDEGGVRVWRKA
jgi:hypothetical protein